MGHETNHYETKIDYSVGDHASVPLGTIARKVASLGHGVEKLNHRFAEFRREQNLTTAAMLGVGIGLGAWIEKSKEANAEFFRVNKGVTSVLDSMLAWPKGISTVEQYTRAAKLGAQTTDELEEQSVKFAMSLDEVGSSYKTLAVSVAPLHLSQERVLQLNEAVTASAKRFGMDGSQAAEIVGRALLTKTIRPVGLLGKYLRNEVGGSLKKLNSAQILDKMSAALQKQVPAAELMSQGIGDSLFRIRARVDKIFRGLTGPLFKEVAHYLDDWNTKIKGLTDSGKIAEWGQKLVGVFKEALKVSDWLHEHWKSIAAIWAGMQLSTSAAGLGKMAAGLSGAGGMAGQIGGVIGKLGAFGMSLGAVTVGLGTLWIALNAFSDWADKKLDERDQSKQGARSAIGALDTLGHFGMNMTPTQEKQMKKQFETLHHAGVMSDTGKVDKQALAYHLGNLPYGEQKDLAKQYGMLTPGKRSLTASFTPESLAEKMAQKISPYTAGRPDLLPGAKAAAAIDPNDKGRHFKGNVQAVFTGPITIQQSFEDVDPDRVWIGTKRGIEEQAERRVMSSFSPNFGST